MGLIMTDLGEISRKYTSWFDSQQAVILFLYLTQTCLVLMGPVTHF